MLQPKQIKKIKAATVDNVGTTIIDKVALQKVKIVIISESLTILQRCAEKENAHKTKHYHQNKLMSTKRKKNSGNKLTIRNRLTTSLVIEKYLNRCITLHTIAIQITTLQLFQMKQKTS